LTLLRWEASRRRSKASGWCLLLRHENALGLSDDPRLRPGGLQRWERADAAMYDNKRRRGRRRTLMATPPSR
jgi:hypothetical protein